MANRIWRGHPVWLPGDIMQGVRYPPRSAGPAIARWLRVVGPAWIVMLADVDAPSVITAGKGGTESGYALLLHLRHRARVVPVQEMTARLALVTGKGMWSLYGPYGPRLARSPSSAWRSSTSLPTCGVRGIALGAAIVGIPAPIAIIGALAIHASMVLSRSYSWFERFALVLSLALFSFVALAVAVVPIWVTSCRT